MSDGAGCSGDSASFAIGVALPVGGEAWNQLREYCRALPGDSFSPGGLTGANLKVENEGWTSRVTLTLPAACCVRSSFISKWLATVDACMEEVAGMALQVLGEAGQTGQLKVEHDQGAENPMAWPIEGGGRPRAALIRQRCVAR